MLQFLLKVINYNYPDQKIIYISCKPLPFKKGNIWMKKEADLFHVSVIHIWKKFKNNNIDFIRKCNMKVLFRCLFWYQYCHESKQKSFRFWMLLLLKCIWKCFFSLKIHKSTKKYPSLLELSPFLMLPLFSRLVFAMVALTYSTKIQYNPIYACQI